MTWRRVLEEALERPVGERAAWVAEACAGDDALRARVMQLLAAADEDDGFLEPPPRPAGFGVGQRIGPYRLQRRLGTGGMGAVYLAEREEPRRRVALKVVQAGLGDADAAARFRYEVEVLATLEHPGIARMYETGVEGDTPWFAMEYVENARTIVDYANANELSAEARIALFAEVCDAVHHGHTKGIVHRDLKPDNLMVDAEGRCKVIDFGVARATNLDLGRATLRTTTGAIVGTLRYMSPEQIAGDRAALDTRSDVYSLGVVLYELLAGELPYAAGADQFETMRAIKEDPPRTLGPEFRGAVETIVFKCLSKEPPRRYDSAAALADDLRRHLAHEPIAAHPPSLRYRIGMFSRRHRVLVAASVVILIVSIGAAVISTLYALDARDSEKTALTERDRAQLLFHGLLERNRETYRFVPRVNDLAGGGATALEMTKAVMADLAFLEGQSADDPDVRRQVAESYFRLAELRGDPGVNTNMGDRKGALAAYRRSIALAEGLRAEQPENEDVKLLLARGLLALGRMGNGRSELRDGAAICEELRASRDETIACTALSNLIMAHRCLATLVPDDEPNAVRRHVETMYELAEELDRRRPGYVSRYELARSRMTLAGSLAGRQEWALAARQYEVLREELQALGRERPAALHIRFSLAWCEMCWGRCCHFLKQWDAAAEHLERARMIYRDVLQRDPDNVEAKRNLAQVLVGEGALNHDHAGAMGPAEQPALLARARAFYVEAWRLWVVLEKKGTPPPSPITSAQIRDWIRDVDRAGRG